MKAKETIPLVDLAAQYRSIKSEVGGAIQNTLDNGQFILGPEVEVFEREFAQFIGSRYAVAVSSGLDALRLALSALDIGPGHEVLVPANTFIATALAVTAVGAKPVFVDCDPGTYNIDADLIEARITPRTKAIIPVHLAGQPADMDPIMRTAKARRLHVVEDAAQAHGALYKGKSCGTLGVMGCFSFYPGKNLGAYGDGGALTTEDPALAQRLRSLRHYGQRTKNEHEEKGLNARLDSLQAAILSVKLRHLADWNAARASHAEEYRAALDGAGDVVFQTPLPNAAHVYHLFYIETGRRDDLREHLSRAGIETGIHYPKPIHLQKAYGDLGYKRGDFPVAESKAGRLLSLPMYAELSDGQIQRVGDEIKAFFASVSANAA